MRLDNEKPNLSEMTEVHESEHEIPRMTRAVQWLIALNVIVYFVQFTVVGAGNMQGALGFAMDRLPSRWWTIGTHLFVHGGFWQLVLNMYVLFLFGPRLEAVWGKREFRNFYFWCGLGGWVVHALLVRDSVLLGSTAAVLGVAMAYGSLWAEEEVYLFLAVPVRVKWLVGMMIGIALALGVTATWPGSGLPYLTSVGGVAAAWVFLRTSSGVGIDRLRQRVSSVPDVSDEPPRVVPRSMPRRERVRDVDDIVAQSQLAVSRQRAAPSEPATPGTADRRTEFDRVLDKISQLGIDSLTAAERRVLEEWSRELRRD